MDHSFSVPDQIDGPLIVIGDIHGQHELLDALLAQLEQRADFLERWIVFVGDFVDRGPSPRQVIERILQLRQSHGKVTACMGNHELALLGALRLFDHPDDCNWDYRYAGHYDCRTTCLSYVPAWSLKHPSWPARLAGPSTDPGALRDERRDLFEDLCQAMPEEHRKFLMGLPWCIHHPDFLIVHAGLEGDQPLDEQLQLLRERDFTDAHPPWLCHHELADTPPPPGCRQTVVSGHVSVMPNGIFPHPQRILIDTGAAYPGFGALSAVLLPEREVVSIKHGEE